MPRFYKSPTWKHLVTRRDSLVVTDLTRLASNRTARVELGGPAFLQGFVPSDDFRVYFPTDDQFTAAEFDPFYAGQPDGPFGEDKWNYPRLAEGVRLMYSFRREAPAGGDPWVIRHAGPVLELEDDADPDRRTSRFVAYDPWGYLYQLPVRRADFDLVTPDPTVNPMPGEQGTVFPAGTTGDEIVTELLRRTIEEDGLTYIDAGTAFGGTADYAGTIDTTASFVDPIVFPRGTSVGQAWEQLVDTGTLDIVLTPIWDPLNRPGYCAELNVLSLLGGDPGFGSVLTGFPSFRWDRTGRHLVRINHLQEGRERANRIRAFSGGTGAASNPWDPPGHVGHLGGGSPDLEATWSDGSSSARFGESWLQQTYVRQVGAETVSRQAEDELRRRRTGARTWRLLPTPEFSPRPFQDYMPGSYLSFYHSRKLREEQWWIPNQFNDQYVFPRITGFSMDISDSTLETITALDITLDDPPSVLIS
jgi:hypothetical protein